MNLIFLLRFFASFTIFYSLIYFIFKKIMKPVCLFSFCVADHTFLSPRYYLSNSYSYSAFPSSIVIRFLVQLREATQSPEFTSAIIILFIYVAWT